MKRVMAGVVVVLLTCGMVAVGCSSDDADDADAAGSGASSSSGSTSASWPWLTIETVIGGWEGEGAGMV